MYQESLIGSSKVKTGDREFCIDYYLITQPNVRLENIIYDAFGVRVTSYYKEEKLSVSDQVLDLSSDREAVEAFCFAMIVNQVTPEFLREMIEDDFL